MLAGEHSDTSEGEHTEVSSPLQQLRGVLINLLKAIYKREDTSEHWAPVTSSEWYTPNFLWRWLWAHRVTDISFSPSNDWLSKAHQDSCSHEHVKLLSTLNQPRMPWGWPRPCWSLGKSFPTGDIFLRASFVTAPLQGAVCALNCQMNCAESHRWLQWQVCAYIWSFHRYICGFFWRSGGGCCTHTCLIPRGRSGAVPLCLPHSLEQLLLLTPSAELFLARFWPCTSLPYHWHQGTWELPGGIWHSPASSHNPTEGLDY